MPCRIPSPDPVHNELVPSGSAVVGLHFTASVLPPIPASHLEVHGGVPSGYTPYSGGDVGEWPVFFDLRVSGQKLGQGAYLDRHALASVIGADLVQPYFESFSLPARLHVDLPWKGRGEPFFYNEVVEVPLLVDRRLVLIERFAVVHALKGSVILGDEFAVRNGA